MCKLHHTPPAHKENDVVNFNNINDKTCHRLGLAKGVVNRKNTEINEMVKSKRTKVTKYYFEINYAERKTNKEL